MRHLALLVAAVVLGFYVFTTPATTAASEPPPVPARPTAFPVEFDIPSIDSRSTLDPLTLDSGGVLEPPPVDQPMQAGWYVDGVKPGDPGPAVIAGHVSGRGPNNTSIPGVFHELWKLKPGDQIHILRSDDSEVSFVVVAVETYEKDKFPTQRVYGDTVGSELRLITCGGDYDAQNHRYLANVVVYAALIA
jgi:LPXTG-site transpeptidase (sortase) family protein